jgi:peptidyl-prolyl cis-trans isomerase SurA
MVIVFFSAVVALSIGTSTAAFQDVPRDTSEVPAGELTEDEQAGADAPREAAPGDTARAAGDPAGETSPDASSARFPMEEGRTWDLDGIAAIVNNSLILSSEVEEQTFLFVRQQGISASDSSALVEARREVLDRLIEEKVIVDEARKRGMTVTREDVDSAVEGVIRDMRRATGSEEAFRRELAREGLTEQGLRDIYRPRLEAQILASRLVRREVGSEGDVTEAEVERYYEENKDSFPERPESIRLSHIYVSVVPDSAAYELARQRAEEIRSRVLAGEDFADLASEYSADPSAASGGDLGYFKRGQLDPAFEQAVFSLEPGEISEVVQSRLGFHVIKLADLKGESARAGHILIPVTATAENAQRALTKATRIKVALDSGEDFTELARTESEDLETRDIGGDLGYFAVDEIAEPIRETVLELPVGEISDVTQAPDGYHIFLKTEYKPRGRYTLEETKEEIREFVRNEKLQKGYDDWVEDLKEDAYIDIKLD